MHTLNLEQLKAATLSGGVIDVTLRGDGGTLGNLFLDSSRSITLMLDKEKERKVMKKDVDGRVFDLINVIILIIFTILISF